MNLRDIPRALSPIGWAVGAVLLALLVMAVWWFMFRQPAHNKALAKQAEVAGALADSRTKSAGEATETIVRRADANAARDADTRRHEDEIRKAPGAAQKLDPGLNAAGGRSVCDSASYRSRPECVQLLGPVEPSGARPRR